MYAELSESTSTNRWEYANLIYDQWKPRRTWVSLVSPGRTTTTLARETLWQMLRPTILKEIQRWQADGWEPVEDATADLLKLRKTEYVDGSVEPALVVLWVMTLGVALIISMLTRGSPRRYAVYEAVEYRLPMRRTL